MSINSAQEQLNKLFMPEDNVWTGSLYEFHTVPDSNFFCINPLKDMREARVDANVSTYRNFLFEFDGGSLAEQESAIEKLKAAQFNVASIVFSGSKSYHLIVSLADTLTCDYKIAWQALSSELTSITNLIADPSCKNPSRLSRLAGADRGGIEQALVYVGDYVLNEYVQTLVSKYDLGSAATYERSNINAKIDYSMDLDTFEFELNKRKGIKNKIMNTHLWAKPENNYPELLKLTLWIIDEIGAPERVVLEYCKSIMGPKLRSAGYDANKLDIAIRNAYNYKF